MTEFETLVNAFKTINLPYELHAATVEVGEGKTEELVNVVTFEVGNKSIFFVFNVDGRLEKVL